MVSVPNFKNMKLLTRLYPSAWRFSLVTLGVGWSCLCSANLAFGAKDPTDVTAAVASAVQGDKLSISANNERFGDTAHGLSKRLHVEYRVGAEKLSRDIPEGGNLEIVAPTGQKLVILKAVYGPADGSKPAMVGQLTEAPGEVLDTLQGFKIEHVLRADGAKNGSWICLAKDPQGRLLLGGQSGQPITRVTLKEGKCVGAEILRIPISETMGMLFVGEVLYITGNGPKGFALYRCKDSKGDQSYGDVEFLREWNGGSGEHGAHGLVLGADKMLYAVCGNFTKIPKDLVGSSPHRNYADDLAIRRIEDGNGFGSGNPPPGGYVVRMDLDGKNAELFSAGQRNNYDIAFNADGQLFGFDSDMEWDWGSPWYRPVRVFHSVRGGDQGFREGSAKWPEYYADSLPASVNIGLGCPTGVVFGTGAKFPVKYQKAFYICDWTYGRLMAVQLTPKGASYTGKWENFVAPKSLKGNGRRMPLNLTDVIIGADGALYFTTGGRGTQADLFRVTYTGSEVAIPLSAEQLHEKEGSEARELRVKLEGFNRAPDPAAVGFAWPYLGNRDRFIRYAARMAIERNPVEEWQAKALAERQPDAALNALLALARLGAVETQPAIFQALKAFPLVRLSEDEVLNKLRILEVSIARQGVPSGEVAESIIKELDPLYPASTELVNRELSQVLIALNAPNAVAKTVALLKSAKTQEEQLSYAVALRKIKVGWTEALRRDYLSWWVAGRSTEHPPEVVQWFKDVGTSFNNGSSFQNLLKNALNEAKASIPAADLVALGDLSQPKAVVKPVAEPRKFVKDWKTADLLPRLDEVGKGRDFTRGKAAFTTAQCVLCHRYGDQGGAAGPDLTAIATRFKRQDILESITEPSKVVSEQYMNTAFTLTGGKVVVGRIAQESGDKVVILTNPFETTPTTLNRSEITGRELSRVSIMPPGLLSTLSAEETLDLLAYLESLGDPNHPNFRK